MTHLKLSAVLLGATALTLPLGTTAFAQQAQQPQQGQVVQQGQQGQQGQQAQNQQNQEMGACEKLLQVLREANEEDLLEQFQNSQQLIDQGDNESCALVISEVEQAGGISEQAVAERRGIAVLTETETFRATDTVSETVAVEIDRRAIVEGQVLVRQPIPQVDIEEGRAEVQVRERPGRIQIDEEPATIEIRQAAANVRVAVPRPTVTIEQPAPEIIITMPPPGLSVERDQPQVDVVMAEPTVTVTQEDPEVSVNVDARLVDANTAVAEPDQPRVQTRAERVDASGQQPTQEQAEVAVRKVKPSIRFLTADVQDEVTFNRSRPRITYQQAEPNVEVTFNDEPRVEIRQTGEPRVRLRREGEDQAMMQGGQQQPAQAQQGQQQPAQGQQGQQQPAQGQQGQQATIQPQESQQATVRVQQGQAQQGQQAQQGTQGQFTATIAEEDELVVRVDRRIQSASMAIEQQDAERARSEIDRASRSLDTMMQQADPQTQQELQGLRQQLDLVVVSLDEQDWRGAETALYDVETNLQQNRRRWIRVGGEQQGAMEVEREGVIERTAEGAGNVIGQGVAAVGEGVNQVGQEVGQAGRSARLSLEDTNRLLAAEEGANLGEARLTNVRAGDLQGANVHTVRGEEIGEIEGFASAGGQLYAIVSHGGFLGIGEDDVAIPLERIAMRGDEVILLGLTEEQLEQMPNYDFAADQEFTETQPVEIGRFE